MKWTASSIALTVVLCIGVVVSLYAYVGDYVPQVDGSALMEPDGVPFDDGTREPKEITATLDSVWDARGADPFQFRGAAHRDTTITGTDTTIYLR